MQSRTVSPKPGTPQISQGRNRNLTSRGTGGGACNKQRGGRPERRGEEREKPPPKGGVLALKSAVKDEPGRF